MPDLSPYLGRWVALVRGRVAGVGEGAEEAAGMAKHSRPKERVELLYVSPEVQVAQGVERTPIIGQAFDLAGEGGATLYLVGGSVRDLLLGRETHDLDFAVAGDGLAVARALADALGGSYVTLDRERKTGRAVLTFQREGDLPWRSVGRLYLDVASLRGEDLLADLRDRDFTINAMAVERTPEGEWRLVDPLGGCGDLLEAVLRATTPSSFVHDPVRTLRAVRMQVAFGCAIEGQTEGWLRSAAPLLSQVSAERVRDEWFKILALPGAGRALRALHELGLLRIVAPPMAQLEGVEQSPPHHSEALVHSFEVVDAVEQLWAAFQGADEGGLVPDALLAVAPQIRQRYEAAICDERSYLATLKCAAFLHDVGKGETQEVDEEGRIRFMGHEQAGAEIAARLGRAWRCSGVEVEMLRTAVRAHMRPTLLATQPPVSRRAIYRFFRDAGEYGVDAAFIALADYVATRGPEVPAEGWRAQVNVVAELWGAYYERKEVVVAPPPLVSGHDLMGAFGLAPGPQIGALLGRIREAQAAGEIRTRDEAMDGVREWLGEMEGADCGPAQSGRGSPQS